MSKTRRTYLIAWIAILAVLLAGSILAPDGTGGESVDGGLELEETAAILADGTEVVSTEGGGSRTEDGNWFSTCQWPVPIDVENVTALRIGETEIPIP